MAKKINKNSKEYLQNIFKQRFLNNHGIKVKIDGSWGPWQEQQYKKLTSRDKHYNTTPYGFLLYLYDLTLGDGTTYLVEPEYVGEIKSDNKSLLGKKLDLILQHNDNPIGWFYLNVIPTAGVASFIVNPIMTARTIIPGTLVGGTVGFGVNALSKKATGKTTEELTAPYIGNELSFLGNPGNYAGAKTSYNFKNLGRFVMDDVPPASYIGHGKDFVLAFTKALNPLSKVPRFFNRRPTWYRKGTTIGDLDFRFENMAQWIGIPEKEVPRILTFDNGDGTRGFKRMLNTADLLPEADNMKIGEKIIHPDFQFGIGGEHSDFTLKAKNKNGNLWLYEDELKLNPQYMLTDKIKKSFKIKKGSKPDKFIDYFAKKDLKGILGFDHDIKYKLLIYENTKDGSVHLVQPF